MEKNRHRNKDKYKIFCDAILSISSVEECECFMFDLFTMPELDMLTQRLQIAKCFYEGAPTYNQVVESVKVSSATVSRVRQAYKHGNDGFKIVFDKIKNKKGRSE